MCGWVLYEEKQKFFSFCAYGFGVYRHRLHIKYGEKKSTAEEIEGYLDTIVSYLTEKGCDVILFNAPPQDFKETNEGIRTALNEKIPAIAEKYGAKFFDFSALLSTEAEPEKQFTAVIRTAKAALWSQMHSQSSLEVCLNKSLLIKRVLSELTKIQSHINDYTI